MTTQEQGSEGVDTGIWQRVGSEAAQALARGAAVAEAAGRLVMPRHLLAVAYHAGAYARREKWAEVCDALLGDSASIDPSALSTLLTGGHSIVNRNPRFRRPGSMWSVRLTQGALQYDVTLTPHWQQRHVRQLRGSTGVLTARAGQANDRFRDRFMRPDRVQSFIPVVEGVPPNHHQDFLVTPLHVPLELTNRESFKGLTAAAGGYREVEAWLEANHLGPEAEARWFAAAEWLLTAAATD